MQSIKTGNQVQVSDAKPGSSCLAVALLGMRDGPMRQPHANTMLPHWGKLD